ncbi:thiamine-phosphate pyrophosphorylase [Limimaricola soesokkakensis]|uniref:Thiamine-phosphate pyrophosphorylase n=1 Tax=Limimaricola soesokkakensis TaxID=1343159 RepID=A0A1X6ZGX1_9RHOB|nr:thiamine phosphate synthase [Limimaricola soesokkakensis]PSK86016.1 thiamine-phosphate pyrophosphorylase [Limimaricola soesokkakensis]SLN51357.1 thiamine-phosphate pyrophosphorylase [Limimaricola soesokkakensis]
MSDQDDAPQIYLVTPPEFELSEFPDRLAACLDATPVACVRLGLATRDEDRISRAADALREVTIARDVALVIDSHARLVTRLGLDGVHLTDGARSVRATRKELGEDAIVGAFCGNSRHDGMTAGELGADYVSFGPTGATDLGTTPQAEAELFEWWSMMIEVPVVAEGALDPELVRRLAQHADFFGIGEEIWREEDAAEALRRYASAMAG